MQLAMTAMAVVGGMVFSLAVALLVEHLIFGKVFRLFFGRQQVRQTVQPMVPQTVPVENGQRR